MRSYPNLLRLALALGGLLVFSQLQAAPPAAPSNFVVTMLGVNAYKLQWTDNSTDEALFRLQAREFGIPGEFGTVRDYDYGPAADLATGPLEDYLVFFDDLLNQRYEFRLVAVATNGVDYSLSQNSVANTTPSAASFLAPSGLNGTATDGKITLSWTDNANSEWGYEVEGSADNGQTFVRVLTVPPNHTIGVAIGGHAPSTTYLYRARAYKVTRGPNNTTPTSYTNYSQPVPITTQPLNLKTPTLLSATVTNERYISLSQQDLNDAESGTDIEFRLQGTVDWTRLGQVDPDAPVFGLFENFFDPASTYEFRLRAYRLTSTNFNESVFSDYSNTASATTTFNAPSNLQATTLDEGNIRLDWQDHSNVEGGFEVQFRVGATSEFARAFFVDAGETDVVVGSLQPGTAYEFRIRSAYAASVPAPRDELVFSSPSNASAAKTRDTYKGPLYFEMLREEPFHLVLDISKGVALTTNTLSNLPPNLSYDPVTQTLSGTPPVLGATECPLHLVFADGWTVDTTLGFRVLQRPSAVTPPAPLRLIPHATTPVSLASQFSDGDSETAVLMNTTLGAVRILLFNTATPLSVANFRAYADAGDYNDTVFHRSMPGFVVQGGGYRPDPANGPTAFTEVPDRAPLQNEPGLAPVRGTISMAKLPGQADSATNEFFFNLDNNGDQLNNQSGGFAVFGRMPLADMGLPDNLAALPQGTFMVTVNGANKELANYPFATDTTMANTNSVRILSVTPISVLNFSIVSNSAPGVVSAAIAGDVLNLTPMGSGTAVLTVRATDLDGLQAEQTLTYTVPQFFADWADGQNLPVGQEGSTGNPDGDRLSNFEEFAFVGDPNLGSDAQALRPVYAVSNQLWSAEFNLRKDAFLDYSVWAGDTLPTNGWTRIWSSSVDGLSAPVIVSQTDVGTHLRLRVRDPQGSSSNLRFMALEVREP